MLGHVPVFYARVTGGGFGAPKHPARRRPWIPPRAWLAPEPAPNAVCAAIRSAAIDRGASQPAEPSSPWAAQRAGTLGDGRSHPHRERQQDPREQPRGDGLGYGGQEFAEQPGRARHETHEGGDHVGTLGVGELVVAEGSASRRLAVISGAGSDPTPQWNSYGSPHAR